MATTVPESSTSATEAALVRVYREQIGRIVATLIRVLGDFDLAEEIAHDAFAAALEQWPTSGAPDNPAGWLVQTARHKAIDEVRRRGIHKRKLQEARLETEVEGAFVPEPEVSNAVEDDRLRLMFTCCHPALALDAQVALTLRTLGGLTTEEIARAFLIPSTTMAQRLVRAKGKIRDAKIPYRVPPAEEIPERLEPIMTVVYLVFTEGYAATQGDALIRRDLCAEAIRLGLLLERLLPAHAEIEGLCALMLLHDSRRDARQDEAGDLVLLEEQDRSRWDREEIEAGLRRTELALRHSAGAPGPFALQAAIVACHSRAPQASETDWPQIAALYEILARVSPSRVVLLNRAVALAMVHGPARGLAELETLGVSGDLDGYHLYHSARADFHRRLGDVLNAGAAYRRALALAQGEPERRFLARRLRELTS